MCTYQLKNVLDNWNVSTNMIVGDLYTFTMTTGEVFRFTNLGVDVLAEVPAGRFLSYPPTPAGSSLINVYAQSAVLGRWAEPGQLLINLTHPNSIIPNTHIASWAYSGGSYGFTITMDQDATAGGLQDSDEISACQYYVAGPRFSRTKVKTQIGPQIDELEVDMLVGGDDYIVLGNTSNMTWQEAIFHGLFDGGYCRLDRTFFATNPGDSRILGTCQGSITWFYGRLSDITVGRTKITIKVKSLLDLLTIQMPRRLYQASCGWIFGAPGCDYNRVTGAAPGGGSGTGQVGLTMLAGSDQNHLVFDTGVWVPNPTDIYDNGTITSLNGLNLGYSRTIGMISGNTIYFLKPWIFPVVAGDEFNLLPGCNHTQSRCADFHNTDRFGGFPYIPPPETAI
jgi:hypothetical protein